MEVKRIYKKTAKRLYDSGTPVMVLASKMSPYSPWNEYSYFFKSDCNLDFDNLISEFKFYNCNQETGESVKFYQITKR